MNKFEIGQEYPVRHTGISKLTTKLLKREGAVCLFIRNDKYYEIGTVKHALKDYTFPGGNRIEKGDESYFTNEDFGQTAWTTKNFERANEIFTNLCKNEQQTIE